MPNPNFARCRPPATPATSSGRNANQRVSYAMLSVGAVLPSSMAIKGTASRWTEAKAVIRARLTLPTNDLFLQLLEQDSAPWSGTCAVAACSRLFQHLGRYNPRSKICSCRLGSCEELLLLPVVFRTRLANRTLSPVAFQYPWPLLPLSGQVSHPSLLLQNCALLIESQCRDR